MKEWLREIRGERSYAECGRLCGMATASYWSVENRDSDPYQSIAKQIGVGLNFDWKLFYQGDDRNRKVNVIKNEIYLQSDCAILKIKFKGLVLDCLFDLEDVDKVRGFPNRWHAQRQNKDDTCLYITGYLYSDITRVIKFHHFIVGKPNVEQVVDHIDGNPLNNQKANLRIITRDQNQQNRKGASKNNKVGIRGVTWMKKQKVYRARIVVNKKEVHLGTFTDPFEAEKVVIEARKKYMPYSNEAS